MYKPKMAPAITGNNIAKSMCTKKDKNAHVTNVNVIMDIVKKSKHSHGSMNCLLVLLDDSPLHLMETDTIKRMPQMMATPE
jgi:hypothetical protein